MSGAVPRRRHAFEGAPPLAAAPLDAASAAIGFFAAELEGARLVSAHVSPSTSSVPRGGREPVFALPPQNLPRLAPAPADARVSAEHDGSILRLQVRTGPGVAWFGGGLAMGRLRRDGRTLVFWNTDAARYGEATPALYSSLPCALAVLEGGAVLGVLADSAARGQVTFAPDGLELAFEDDFLRVVLLEGGADEVLRAVAALCGRIERPPRWALGHHHSRWGHASAAELAAAADAFRARGIPCDALWLDIDHMDRQRTFTWDARRFPEPARALAALHARGFRAVAIADPGVAAAADNPLLAGAAFAHFVQDARGAHAKGRVWPGACLFPDFTRSETRAWWAEHARAFVAASGLDGLWCDMNEPALFRAPLSTLPDDARHAAGLHARVHNLYGHLMVEATRDGLARARPERRPFVLTRAGSLATAALASTWTGDNQATWADLRASIPMVLGPALSGQPFSGPDAGGFEGDPDPELFARWFELAAYLPFCRGHSHRDACRKEPWAFGAAVEARVRAALERRMALVPHLETLFEECARTGLPPARPVWCADPGDARLLDVDDAFLLGRDLLVAPCVEPGADAREVLLPAHPGGWYAFPAGGAPATAAVVRAAAPAGTTPVFARAGSALVTAQGAQHAAELAAAPRTLHAFLDPGGSAHGRGYEDEGDGHAWRSGAFRDVTWSVRVTGSRVEVGARVTGTWTPPPRAWSVRVHLADGRLFARDGVGDPSAGLALSLR